MTILSGDWYGFTNALALVLMTVVRGYLIQAHRNSLGRGVRSARPLRTTFTGAIEEWEKNLKHAPDAPRPEKSSRGWRPEVVKTLVELPDARLVAMFMPEHLIRPVFVADTAPRSPSIYRLVQWMGWIAFCVHIITLGMAQLATQIYVVVVMVLSTVLLCYGVGCDDSRLYKWWHQARYGEDTFPYVCRVGRHLKATVSEWPSDLEFIRGRDGTWSRRNYSDSIKREQRSTARQDLYAWINLSSEEIRCMSDWHLLPHRRSYDDSWWVDFEAKKLLVQREPLDMNLLKDRKPCTNPFQVQNKKKHLESRFFHCGSLERGKFTQSRSSPKSISC